MPVSKGRQLPARNRMVREHRQSPHPPCLRSRHRGLFHTRRNTRPGEFRAVTRSHVISWRKDLEACTLSASTIRRKLSALSSLFEYLCECNSVPHNPVDGIKRPSEDASDRRRPLNSPIKTPWWASVTEPPCRLPVSRLA